MSDQPNLDAVEPDLSAEGVWQKTDRESAGSYALFLEYLQLPPGATFQHLADKSGKTINALWLLSSRHQWSLRATAWRQHLASLVCASVQNAQLKHDHLWTIRHEAYREQAWEQSEKLATVCSGLLDQLLAKPDPEVSPYELARLLTVASAAAKEALGSPPQTAPPAPATPAEDPLVLEFRAALAAQGALHRPPEQSPCAGSDAVAPLKDPLTCAAD